MERADNAATAQAKSILLTRRVFETANPQIANEALDPYASDETRVAMRLYSLGRVTRERRLTLSETSNADDKRLADAREQDFCSQERVDASLTRRLLAVNKGSHESRSKGAAGRLAALRRVKRPRLSLTSPPTPGPGDRLDVAARLAFATLINRPARVARLRKSELLGSVESVKDGALDKAIRR